MSNKKVAGASSSKGKVAGASSSKASGTREQDAPTTLLPKLRFPEFRDAPGWKSKPMSKVYSFKGNNSLSRDKLNYERGTVKNIHYGDIHTKFATHFDITKELVPFINPTESLEAFKADNFCVESDMIFADASEDLADIGKAIEIVGLNGERVVSGLHTILARQNEDVLFLGFGGHLFKSKWVRTQIQKESQGSKVLGLSGGRLAKIEVPFPSPAEQQKIAECLTTLDEVIAAQSQKLAALKTHKKGLMQQLFPREGETLPRLRFPEFQSAPEWEESTIQELIDKKFIVGHLDGNHGSLYPRAEEFSQSGVPYISANCFSEGSVDFRKCKFLPQERAKQFRKGVARDGDILFAHNATVGPVAKLNTDCDFVILSTSLTYFRCNPRFLVGDFLRCLLVSPAFVDQYTGVMAQSTRNQIPITTQRTFSLQVPTLPEQQRIATCLTSLDDLITAQSAKLESLKTHKRGLMQQLFPSPQEVEA